MRKPKPVKRCCVSCKWADYLKTPTGKPKKGVEVNCFYPVDKILNHVKRHTKALLPNSVHVSIEGIRLSAHGMWPDDPECDGHDCPVWEPVTKEDK